MSNEMDLRLGPPARTKSFRRSRLILYSLVFGLGLVSGMTMGTGFKVASATTVLAHDEVLALVSPITLPTPTTIPLSTATAGPAAPSPAQFQQAHHEITRVSQYPVKMIYQTKMERIEVMFESEQIRTILTTSVWGNQVLVVIDQEHLSQVVLELARQIDRQSKFEVDHQNYEAEDRKLDQLAVGRWLRDELFGRLAGRAAKGEFDLTELVQELPGHDGSLAQKYLEVDLSQQKLYQWENGQVMASRIISTGKYGPTPVGVYQIMNKAKNAWSPPAQVWMPYWMAYGYSSDLAAYLGFHELPYWKGPQGEIIRRPFDNLGEPNTGGCIQLNVGDAEAVYGWTEVGTPVLIHQ